MAKRKPQGKRQGKKRSKKKKGSIRKKLILLFLFIILLVFGSGALFYYSVRIGIFGKLPTTEELQHIRNSQASELISADGKVMGRYFVQNRTNAQFENIPQDVVNALVATEDARFFEHEGIDPVSVARVIFKTIIMGDRSSGGGSTISQQLAKNLYGRKNHDVLSIPVNKMKENIIALELEDIYTKQEIIELYLNTVPFGEDVYGIETASLRFFGKKPNRLTIPEAATLVGMLKAPTTYNPRMNPDDSQQRRNVVMHQMTKYGYLAEDRYEQLADKPIELNYTRLSGSRGMAPYFRAMIRKSIEDELGKLKKPDGSAYDLYSDGLRIYTTIDSRLQSIANEAVRNHMAQLQDEFNRHWKGRKPWKNSAFIDDLMKRSNRYKSAKARGLSEEEIQKEFNTPVEMSVYTPEGTQVRKMSPYDSIAHHQMILQAGFLAMEPQSGAIRAYVGGIDFSRFPYDHVHSRRQVGSTFKPIVYLTALEQGIEPCEFIPAKREVYEEYDDYSPGNADGEYEGLYSMRGALANSVNTVSVKVLMQTGIERVIRMAKALGIENELPEAPSLALGTADISLAEMVRAYTVFNNQGNLARPMMISRIEDGSGNIIRKFSDTKAERIVGKDEARTVLGFMEEVVETGTGRALKSTYGLSGDIAGKTGTTQNNADGWFMSCTPKLVCGAWVGGESPIVRFRTTALGQGAHMALPIVGSFLSEANRKAPSLATSGSFSEPSEEVEKALSCPPYIDSKLDNFLDKVFGGKNDDSEENGKGKEDKPGFFQRLFGGGKKKDKN